jgi:uncharacterized protein (TIRG00374 family)
VLLGSVVYIFIHRHSFEQLKRIEFNETVSIIFLTLTFFVATGFTFYLLLRILGVKLDLLEIIGLSFITNFGNYLGPGRAGAAVKAVYLKRTKGVAYASFSAVLAANSFIYFFMTGNVGLIFLFIAELDGFKYYDLLLSICAGLVVISLLPYIIKIKTLAKRGKWWDTLNNAITGFEKIKSHKISVVGVCFLMVLQLFISAILLSIIYRALDHPISFEAAFAMAIFTFVSNFFTLTPNNIGIQETVMASLYAMLGNSFINGMVGASLLRIIHAFLTFGLTPLFVFVLCRRKKNGLSIFSKQ